MRVMFVSLAFEQLPVQLLTAILRRAGHQVGLAFSPHLFDDRYYLGYPKIARLIEKDEHVLEQIGRFRPDVLCFSALSVNFRWMVGIAEKAKSLYGVKTVFGGMHPSAAGEIVLEEPSVDFVCIGEGDVALPLLIETLAKGGPDRPIPNMVFRGPAGQIVRGPTLPFFQDLDLLPPFEKDLYVDHFPIDTHYMTMTMRGCPYRCAFCFNNYFADLPARSNVQGGPYLRQRSVDHFLAELKEAKRRYKIKYVHIKDDIFTIDTQWLREFAPRYRREIGVPFYCLSHPNYLDQEKVDALKEAGCVTVQLGVESADEEYKKKELRRFENENQVDKVLNLLYRAGIDRKVDHIFGFPGEGVEAQEKARDIYARHGIERVGVNWLVYLPGTEMIGVGLRHGAITQDQVDRINRAKDALFIQSRAFVNPRDLKTFLAYELLFRLFPVLPKRVRLWLRPQHVRWMPGIVIRTIGVLGDMIGAWKLHDRRFLTFYNRLYAMGLINRVRRVFGLGPLPRFRPVDTAPVVDSAWVKFREYAFSEYLAVNPEAAEYARGLVLAGTTEAVRFESGVSAPESLPELAPLQSPESVVPAES